MTHEGDVIDDVTGEWAFIGFFDEFFPFSTYATCTYDRNFYMGMIARVMRIF